MNATLPARFPGLFEVTVQHRDHRGSLTLSTFRVESDTVDTSISLMKRWMAAMPLEIGGHPQTDYRRAVVLSAGPIRTITEAQVLSHEERAAYWAELMATNAFL